MFWGNLWNQRKMQTFKTSLSVVFFFFKFDWFLLKMIQNSRKYSNIFNSFRLCQTIHNKCQLTNFTSLVWNASQFTNFTLHVAVARECVRQTYRSWHEKKLVVEHRRMCILLSPIQICKPYIGGRMNRWSIFLLMIL